MPYGWHDGAVGDKKAVGATASAGSYSPLLFCCFGRCCPADLSLLSAHCGSPKSRQLQCLERPRETAFGTGTANVAKAGHL
jgi:hypothetical protein